LKSTTNNSRHVSGHSCHW